MSQFESFKNSVASIVQGEGEALQQRIDGHDINIAAMPYGYYLCGRLPVPWDGSEQELHRHLRISFIAMSRFHFSLAANPEVNELYLSYYLAKPKKVEEMIAATESLINLMDIWPAMLNKY